MPPAARIGDSTSHGGVIGPPPPGAVAVATVLIGGRPAAVVGSAHQCVVPQHAALGPANVVLPRPGPALVLIGGLPAACVGDRTACDATVVAGEFTVLIGGGG